MKKIYKLKYVRFVILLLPLTIVSIQSKAQIDCSPGVFYGMGSDRAVYPMTISGSTITLGTPVTSSVSNSRYGLAIADLGTGNKFYSSGTNSVALDYDILEYDGMSWQTSMVNPYPNAIHNAAGRGIYLYYHFIGSSSSSGGFRHSRIMAYGNGILDTIYADTTVFQKVADIAVDNSGNVYFFSGTIPFPNTDVSQLNVISSSGNLLGTFPVTFNGDNAYGCFIENNILYVGLGPGNPVNPNTLLPINLSGATPTLGTPLPMPHPIIGGTIGQPIFLTFSDLASCASEETFISNPGEVVADEVTLYPNPVTDHLNIYKDDLGTSLLNIFDATGRIVLSETLNAKNTMVDLQDLPKGVYTVQTISGNKTSNQKIVKR